MKLLKTLAAYTTCLLLVFMPMTSCLGPLPPAQGNAMIGEIQKQVAEGGISKALGEALIEQVRERMDPENAKGIDWDLVLQSAGGIGLAVLTSITGVRLSRGPAKPMDQSQAELLAEMVARFKDQIADENAATERGPDES